jgi:hemerythrin-like domain-containing protein
MFLDQMVRPVADPGRSLTEEIEAIPENLFREPIDYLFADHYRQRIICKHLDQIAFDPGTDQAARLAEVVLEYLERDLPLHIADEEQDLFPHLRARCEPKDQIEGILTQLSEEHARCQELGLHLSAGLRHLAEGHPSTNEDAFLETASTFAENQRRHFALEERVILPLARKRLLQSDLAELGRSMAARRGAAYPE